jgi:membrane protein
MKRYGTLLEAIYRLYEHSGFALAGAVAFSFVVSLFPFCIFLGALAGVFGGRELAAQSIEQLFTILPAPVVQGLAPEVENIMGRSRFDLLTVGAALALFFATSAIETLRAALNQAYRVYETRSYPLCLFVSMLFVLVSAVSMLFLTWAVVVGPGLAARFEQPSWFKDVLDSTWLTAGTRYALAGLVLAIQLFAFHIWLAAGKRGIKDVWPGVLLSMLLWLALAGLWSQYLAISDYSRFYAGLSQLMVAMIFFQFTAIAVILGAELNRGLLELKKIRNDQEAFSPLTGK